MKDNRIQKFIKDNGLDFSGSGSDLNGNCVIIAGYACYLELGWIDLKDSMLKKQLVICEDELIRVFDYAYHNDYGDWWATDEAKKQYKF